MMTKALLCLFTIGVANADWWGNLKKAIGGETKDKAEDTRTKMVPAFWGDLSHKAQENYEKYSDRASAKEVLKSSVLKISSCSGADHSMQVRDAHFDVNSLELHVKGHLSREVAGGKVVMKLDLGNSSKKMSGADRIKRKIAWVASGKHYDEEPLCKHFGRYEHSCPLKSGDHELRFGFKRLPSAISAGGYDMTVKAVDEVGAPILCVNGLIEVPYGPNGELFRRLAEMASGTPTNILGLGVFFAAIMV
jgi:hypothetical protein